VYLQGEKADKVLDLCGRLALVFVDKSEPQATESLNLPHVVIHKAVVHLLLLAMVMHPLFAFGLVSVESEQTLSPIMSVMDMGDCNAGAQNDGASAQQAIACNEMAPADCTFAANVGSCGSGLSALFLHNPAVPSSSFSGTNSLYSHDRYLSIILDTLTPPPNSSKA